MRLAIVLMTALLATLLPGSAHADDPSYSYLDGLRAQLADPGSAPPGANDWSCRPTPAHPNPVVLLHGLSNDTITWHTLSPALANAGYCVFTTTYGTGFLGPIGGIAPVEDSADQIADFIDRVLVTTETKKVDLIGHSMGGAIPFYYLNRLGGASKIANYVAMAAPLHGSTTSGITALLPLLESTGSAAAALQQCGPCQLTPDSPFLLTLNPDPAIAPDIAFTTIVTRYDQIATPYTTGLLTGRNVRNVVLQDLCPTDFTDHFELPSDPIAVHEVLNALDPTHATPSTCTLVLPFLGPGRPQ